MSFKGGWMPSANVCDVFIKGVLSAAVGFVVVDLIP